METIPLLSYKYKMKTTTLPPPLISGEPNIRSIFGENTAQRLRRSVFTPGGRVVRIWLNFRVQGRAHRDGAPTQVGCYLRTGGYGCWSP